MQLAIVIALGLALFLPFLGRAGFVATEAHRAIPAWEMLDSGRWLVPTLFGQDYVRKPPGLQWLIAATSAILGPGELAARLPSAIAWTAAATLAWLFARRWFESTRRRPTHAPLVAAIAVLLWPWYWSSARSAEIEAVHNLATMALAWCIVDALLVHRPRSRWPLALIPFAALALATTKAAAAAPVVLAAVAAAAWTRSRFARPCRDELEPLPPTARLLASLACAAALVAAVGWPVWSAYQVARDSGGVAQSASEFLWQPERVALVFILPLRALIAAAPWSFLAIWPLGPLALREAREAATTDGPAPLHQLAIARALALACAISLAGFFVLGISNIRYAMPAMAPLAVLAAWLWNVHHQHVMGPLRRTCLRAMTLGHWTVLLALLLTAAIASIASFEAWRSRASGRDLGREIASALPTSGVLAAHSVVEARPEILLALRQAAAERGLTIDTRWTPALETDPELPPWPAPGLGHEPASRYLLLRTDPTTEEPQAVTHWKPRARELGRWRFREYELVLLDASAPAQR